MTRPSRKRPASKIMASLKQARAIAKGEKPAPRVTLFNVHMKRMWGVFNNNKLVGRPYPTKGTARYYAWGTDAARPVLVFWHPQAPKRKGRK